MRESPIFVKTFDMLAWLLRHTRKFPKDQRFVMARRMEEAGLDFQDALLRAARERSAKALLDDADFHLSRLKLYNRLCRQLELHSLGQYEHLARMLAELGKILGGWKKSAGRTSGRSVRTEATASA